MMSIEDAIKQSISSNKNKKTHICNIVCARAQVAWRKGLGSRRDSQSLRQSPMPLRGASRPGELHALRAARRARGGR